MEHRGLSQEGSLTECLRSQDISLTEWRGVSGEKSSSLLHSPLDMGSTLSGEHCNPRGSRFREVGSKGEGLTRKVGGSTLYFMDCTWQVTKSADGLWTRSTETSASENPAFSFLRLGTEEHLDI